MFNSVKTYIITILMTVIGVLILYGTYSSIRIGKLVLQKEHLKVELKLLESERESLKEAINTQNSIIENMEVDSKEVNDNISRDMIVVNKKYAQVQSRIKEIDDEQEAIQIILNRFSNGK